MSRPTLNSADNIIVLDFETAGLKVEEGAVEVAYLEVDSAMRVIGEHHSLIDPEGPISPSAAGVHGITYDMVEDAPTLSEFFKEIKGDPFAGKDVIVIGHNIAFDIRYAAPYIGKAHPLCTLKLARLAFPDSENHKLQTLMFYLGLKKKGRHNALDDVYTSLELLARCGEALETDFEGLLEIVNKPVLIKKMGFGKHKGVKLEALPKEYVTWLLSKCENLDENLRYSLNLLRS